jgi:hypothetical protein
LINLLEIYGKLETKSVYKCFLSYLIKLFSKYIKEGDSDLLMHIKLVLSNENLFSNSVPINYAVTNELKKPCLKKVNEVIESRMENYKKILFLKDGEYS